MNQTNKIIKYFAIAFAIFIIISIFSGIMFGIFSISNIFGDKELGLLREIELSQDIRSLSIDVNSNVTIKKGDKFKLETDSNYLTYSDNNSKLVIKERKHRWFNQNSNLILYIPESVSFNNFSVENGAGKLKIEYINTEVLKLNLGAGKAEISYLSVKNKANIDGGVGEFIISDGEINNLDMDLGVGRVSVTSLITGKSEIDCGVGELDLKLKGNSNDYRIKVDKGIGSFKISGDNISDGKVYGNGNNIIDVDGGIGSININFSDEKVDSLAKKYVRTYNLLHKTEGQEDNSYYLTLQTFQGEVETVLVKDINSVLEVGNNYEFTFERISDKYIEDNIKSIFNNSKIISINKTDKTGLNQVQDDIN